MKNEHIVWVYCERKDGKGHVLFVGLTDEGLKYLKDSPGQTLLVNPPGNGFANVTQFGVFAEKDKATLKQRFRETGVPVSEVNWGFARPYRDSYRHVGRLDLDNAASDAGVDKVTRRVGGCGMVTTMNRAIAETFARDPAFYGSGFCVTCNAYFPNAEFVWAVDGTPVGS